MSLEPLNILPGIYTEDTDRGAKNRWINGSNVRFRKGRPEKVGGSARLQGSQFLGKARSLLAFTTLSDEKFLAVGTHRRVYLYDEGQMINITPLSDSTSAPFSSSALTNPFQTTSGGTTVTVVHSSHGQEEGAFVTFSSGTAVAGLDLNNEYEIQTAGANSYTITAAAAANNTTTGGGTVNYDYELNPGLENAGNEGGWGAGVWRSSTGGHTTSRGWGEPEPGGGGVQAPARTWAFASWGEDLLANERSQKIYAWDASAGKSNNRLAEIANAPDTAEYIVVAPEERFLIVLGAHDGSSSDPLLIRWSDRENYNVFTPSATNEAGDLRLDRGNKIVTGVYARKQILVLTDTASYSLYKVSFANGVWGTDLLATNCGAISPNCAVEVEGEVYWMGISNYYNFAGAVSILDCDIRNFVYDNLTETQFSKILAGVNSEFNEVWWFWPDKDNQEINRYSAYNYQEKIWFTGEWSRTAWIDRSELFRNPVAASASGYLHQHEVGTDDGTSALSAFIESYDVEAGEGEEFLFIKRIIPDFQRLNGSVQITLKARRYPASAQTTKGPKTITSSTEKQNIRIRGRSIAIRIECSNLGDDFRMSEWRADVRTYGER